MNLIQRAQQLAQDPRMMTLANKVNNKIALEHRDWYEGQIQKHISVAILSDCTLSHSYLEQEVGTEVADAVIALQEGTERSNTIAAFVRKVISLDAYLDAIAAGEFDIAKVEWQKVEGLV